MTIDQGLDGLRDNHPGCRLAAFGDLGTRLMLRTSSDDTHPQEYLDRICAQAAQNFALSDKVCPDETASGAGCQDVVIVTPQDARVMVRSADNPSDFLCCICDPAAPLTAIAQEAAQVLQKLSVDT